jgi:hypothetical protein
MKHESTEYIEYLKDIIEDTEEKIKENNTTANRQFSEDMVFALDAYMSFLKAKSEVLNSNTQ